DRIGIIGKNGMGKSTLINILNGEIEPDSGYISIGETVKIGCLPWVMIIVGVFMAIVLYALNLPIMTIAIGFYLPIATTSIRLV
ncbi:ATP-binding cassette domain-containing protein, partial [Clostridioides difficile]|uniref:ATP-binding cassette domain-containing protein n=1 Tax=Clostridioides difficile TaxID=1496 RepID=UPI001EEE85F0